MKELEDIDLKAIIEEETGEKFNREGYIKCPFHNEKTPSMSVKFIPNANKERYMCWGCESKGDAIDFIMNFRNIGYDQAREALGISVEKTPRELQFDKILSRIDWDVKNSEYKPGYKLLGLFEFVNEQNEIVYYKAKFLKPNGKKASSYYRFSGDKIINNRDGIEDIPYNLYNVLQGAKEGKTIIFVEGEKDANNINNLLKNKNYVATSIKGCTDYKVIKLEFMKIMVLGDTGVAGLKYVDNIKYNFLKDASSFKIINLPGLKSLGNNKDVTDWLESGHTKAELMKAFDRSLDLKNKHELQQDNLGVYQLRKSKDEEENFRKDYLTDFNILEASKIDKLDEGIQCIKLKIKSCVDGKTMEKEGLSKIFDDVRAFRNFLGIDFSFTGKSINDLVELKRWINKYFAIDNEEIHIGSKILPIEGKEQFKLITSKGTIYPDKTDNTAICEKSNIYIADTKPIEKQELQELMQHLFRFINYNQAISIIGSALSFLEIGQNIALDSQLHHLFIIGESQTGKTTILEKVVMPLLNYPKSDKKTMSSTTHSIKEELAMGNYPIVYEEFKPSKMTIYKKDELSNIFRSAYDRDAISRGDKGFGVKDVKLTRPMIIAGEETIPNNEKAIITRSCIVYMGRNERTQETSESIFWLQDHKELLEKLGKSIMLEVLNLPIEEYKNLRISLRNKFTLKDRPLNTAVNIACGIELLNKVLIKQGLQPVEDYYGAIEQNILDEVLNGRDDTENTIEQMIVLFNDILQDSNYISAYKAVKTERGKTYIRSQILVDSLFRYQRDYQSLDINLVKIKDFKKQAKKSGYILKANAKQFRDKDTGSNAWYDEYDTAKLVDLNVGEIVECDLMEEAVSMAEQNIFAIK